MEQQRRLRIIERIPETEDAVTFRLEAVDGQPFTYASGQYLSLIFSRETGEKRRAYSFSSSPATDAHPAITVKRLVNGEFSNWLLYHAQVGELLTTSEARGQFVLPEKMPDTLFYLAAGSGITPVISHLKTLFNLVDRPKIVLFYANRDSASTLFKVQLDRWLEQYPATFECVYFFSREKNAAHARFRHLNNELLEQEVYRYFGKRLTDRHRTHTQFYFCAPPPLVRMARMTLRRLDFPADHFHTEAFIPDLPPPTRLLDPAHTHRIIAHRQQERIEFTVFRGETILDGALRQGITLPYSCKSGVCLSCLARCVQGEIEVAFAQLTQIGRPGDMVNTCIGYATTDVVEITYE